MNTKNKGFLLFKRNKDAFYMSLCLNVVFFFLQIFQQEINVFKVKLRDTSLQNSYRN